MSELSVTLIYAGQLAAQAGVSEETIHMAANTGLVDVLRNAAEQHGGLFQEMLFDESDQLRRALVISVDNVQVPSPNSHAIEKDCEVFVMTPIAGG